MATEGKGGDGGLRATGLLWVAILGAGALLFRIAPWEGARPSSPNSKPYDVAALQDIDARLWQDPFTAVAQERNAHLRSAKDGAAASPHDPATLSRDVCTLARGTDGGLLVLGAMVSGSSYAEQAEFRRRARYAILAGLNEGNFIPDDPEHLGYFEPKKKDGKPTLPDFVAFEWLNRADPGAPVTDAKSNARVASEEFAKVLLLPLYEEVFGPNTLAPDDPEHPGYFEPKKKDGEPTLPDFVAFEWLNRADPGAPVTDAKSNARVASGEFAKVLLLWLDEDVFGRNTLAKLGRLLQVLTRDGSCGAGKGRAAVEPRFVVLGPSLSGTLRGMVVESKDPIQKAPTFYSYATADGAAILGDPNVSNGDGRNAVHQHFGKRGVPVYRTIATDGALAEKLAEELALRGLRPGEARDPKGESEASCPKGTHRDIQHVVLISEWDTLYGRSLPRAMAGALARTRAGQTGEAVPASSWIHTFSYLRGLDGQSLGAKSQGDGSSGGTSGSAGGGSGKGNKSGEDKLIERPDGESQFDYVRRLLGQLRLRDDDWRVRGCGRIRAVGVLGSDAYDKLLIMQAVRSELPEAQVFTTDLDARLLHPKQLDWTRNAIVASSYGLVLGPGLQRDIPPFRDGYQTSQYLSTLVALSNARNGGCVTAGPEAVAGSDCITQGQIDGWLSKPRVFEIGRKFPFDFSQEREGKADQECSPTQLAACKAVHPRPSRMFPTPPSGFLVSALGALLAGSILLGFNTGTWKRLAGWPRQENRDGLRAPGAKRVKAVAFAAAVEILVAIVLLVVFQWPEIARHLTENGKGEPIAFSLGVSGWPAELLRAIAFLLSMVFVYTGWKALDRNLDAISKTFMWRPEWRALLVQLEEKIEALPWWKQLVQVFSFDLPGHATGGINPETGLSDEAEGFWYRYLYQNRFWARILRVAVSTAIYFGASWVVIRVLGEPVSPLRGDLARNLNTWITILSVVMMLALIFFVVDATMFCFVLVRSLRWQLSEERGELERGDGTGGSAGRWPDNTLAHYAEAFCIDKKYVDDWITIQFVAKRTHAVAGLVYLPFIVIAIMILARNSLFDRWGTSTALLVIHTASVALVVGCGILLRRASEDLRRRAIRRLSEKRIGLLGQDVDAARRAAAQFDLMISQIKALDTGAFAPYMQQPIVRAMLLPLTSYGGAALLEYLSIAGF